MPLSLVDGQIYTIIKRRLNTYHCFPKVAAGWIISWRFLTKSRVCCKIECELEWRTRISLADAQRTILQHFKDKPNVWVDEYRVRRFAQYQRRVGSRYHYSNYTFSTIGELLTLHGLSPLYEPTAAERKIPGTGMHMTPFSEIKTTNCVHAFYRFASAASLQDNTTWPRLFVFKRSLEIHHFEACRDDERDPDWCGNQNKAQDAGRPMIDVNHPQSTAMFAKAIEKGFADYQRTELDRSDNNLGVATIRKIYRFIPLTVGHRNVANAPALPMIRLAVYSISDEYQQIRHEVGLEYEFADSEQVLHQQSEQEVTLPLDWRCVSGSVCQVAVTATALDTILQAMSMMIADYIAPHIDYVEKPMIKINVDWLEGITSSLMLRLLSYPIPRKQIANEDHFADYLMARLSCLTPLPDNTTPRRVGNAGKEATYFLRRKLDGERLYATYDGGHSLCLSDGVRLDLRRVVFADNGKALFANVDDDKARCRALFSVDFVYQMERVAKHHYYFTEVVAIRHSYSTVLSSLVHTFSPSRNFYRATEEQVWPYALMGSGLDNHSTGSLLDFWLISACPDTAGSLTKELAVTLKGHDKRPAHPHLSCQDSQPLPAEQDTGEATGVDLQCIDGHNDIDNYMPMSPPLCSEEDKMAGQDNAALFADDLPSPPPVYTEEDGEKNWPEQDGLFADAVPSPGMSMVSEVGGSSGDEPLTANEENDDDMARLTDTLAAEPFLHTDASAELHRDKSTAPVADAKSRFFIPVSARDSRRYLVALNRALFMETQKNTQPVTCPAVTLQVNIPIDPASLNRQEFINYYRSYVIRLLNVLFLCGEHDRCKAYAYKHFSPDYASQVWAAFTNKGRCLETDLILGSDEKKGHTTLAIDGYLLYRECADSSEPASYRPHGTKKLSPCALPMSLVAGDSITTGLKLKPFHTIELLMRVNIKRLEGLIDLSSITFLSQLSEQSASSIFFTCTFSAATLPDSQPATLFNTPRADASGYDRRQHFSAIEPDFKSACWTRYDGKVMQVFVDPRLELVDGLVYEFLCYNELELYLLAARPDKVLPDDEVKINSILWDRHSSEDFFPLPR